MRMRQTTITLLIITFNYIPVISASTFCIGLSEGYRYSSFLSAAFKDHKYWRLVIFGVESWFACFLLIFFCQFKVGFIGTYLWKTLFIAVFNTSPCYIWCCLSEKLWNMDFQRFFIHFMIESIDDIPLDLKYLWSILGSTLTQVIGGSSDIPRSSLDRITDIWQSQKGPIMMMISLEKVFN